MIDYIKDIYQKLLEIVNAAGSTMDNLVIMLDDVQFTEDFVVTKSLSIVRYFLDTPLYLMFTTLIQIGAGFILFKLIKIVINSVSNLIPGLKGKIRIE